MTGEIKIMMAQTFERYLQGRRLEKVTVTDIAREAGISRRTFYYHFKDMYDFVFWVHEYLIREAQEGFWEDKRFFRCLCRSLGSMEKHRHFYEQLIKTQGPNSFKDEFERITVERCYVHFGQKPDEDMDFALKLYWHGATDRICEWIEKGMPNSVEWMAKALFESMPEKVQRFYEE